MIEELRISNLGVIESSTVIFHGGMSALTGETGAGKTMTVTAFQLLMGGKADASKVRTGQNKAIVEGTFIVPEDSPALDIVTEAGGEAEPAGDGYSSIIVARHIPANGRSRAFLGGCAVPASVLEKLAPHLATLHGQADQLRLRSSGEQRAAIDAYGGQSLAQALAAYTQAWEQMRQARRDLEDFNAQASAAATKRMAMQMLVSRVDAVQPKLGEDAQLKAEAMRMDNVESLREAISASMLALGADGALGGGEPARGALELLAYARHELERSHDSELEALAAQLIDVDSVISDIRQTLAAQLDQLHADPARLEAIHARRAQIRDLERELGLSVEDMLKQAQEARRSLEALDNPEARRAQLEEHLQQSLAACLAAAETLSSLRRHCAEKLAASVNAELKELYMKDATFSVRIDEREELAAWGADDVHFLLAPHSGAEPMELGRTASGGEMSRIMLAIEVSLAQRAAQANHTFIFDEIDAGIGGKSALCVGKRLAQLARGAQVLCVTHLAQVAAYASSQIVIAKHSEAQGAVTAVHEVTGEAREAELARMLSGHDESHAARTHASELLASVDMAP